MSVTCTHLDQIRDVTPNTLGCEECLKTGDTATETFDAFAVPRRATHPDASTHGVRNASTASLRSIKDAARHDEVPPPIAASALPRVGGGAPSGRSGVRLMTSCGATGGSPERRGPDHAAGTTSMAYANR